MADRFILVAGGARSGKSDFAVELVRRAGGATTFVATAEAGDGDMAERIRRHRADRPASWALVEEPVELAAALGAIDPADHLILDCLTLWVSNLLLADLGEAQIVEASRAVALALAGRSGLSVVVTNEVGLGVHPGTSLGARYRDALGRVNRVVAEASDRALFFSCGKALVLADPHDLVDTGP